MTQLHPQSHLQPKHSLETIHFSDLKKSEKSKKTGTMSNLNLEAPEMEIKDKEVIKKCKKWEENVEFFQLQISQRMKRCIFRKFGI